MARTFTRHTDGPTKIIYAEYINVLQEALEEDDVRIDGKAPIQHTHEMANVEGLVTRLTTIDEIISGLSEQGHTHSASQITSGVFSTQFLPVGTTEGTIAAGDHNHDNVYQKITDAHDILIPLESTLTSHVANKSNPHGVTKAQIGLSNVDNTSDMSKPISTAMNTALGGKANTVHTHDDRYYTETEVNALLNAKSANGHTHDDRYYTESEINSKITTLNTAINGKAAATHNHSASQITSGTLSAARIPHMDLSTLFPNNKTSKAGSSAVRNGPSNNHGVLKILGTGWGLHDTGWRETTDETWAYVMIPQLGFCWVPANRV